MVRRYPLWGTLIIVLIAAAPVMADEFGGIRGTVFDKEYDAPLQASQVTIAETGQKADTSDGGNFVFGEIKPGTYTLVFSKDGYSRQVMPNVIVTTGQMTEINATLAGEVTEMDEFVVQDMQLGMGTEAGLLELRQESPALMDSISSELMSRAGTSDAASALTLVAGTTVQDGKYAVVRGLPDRYVNSQMNGVRLPTADADKRAVQLDQFPAAVIESIQISKTFTPDQQGDASGGAVNVITKAIPDETILQASSELSWNSRAAGRKDFLTYDGGKLNYWGKDVDNREIQTQNFGHSWDGPIGTSEKSSPQDYKWSLAAGGKHNLNDDVKIGGFGDIFYERKSSFFDNGKDDKYWITTPGGKMTPQYTQGTPDQGSFYTSLLDTKKSTEQVKWGGLVATGVETENHSLNLTYLYTHDAQNTVTLAEDTRGKAYYFPGYKPNDPNDPGNNPSNQGAAPYLRTETLEYTERTSQTLQFRGKHNLIPDFNSGLQKRLMFQSPELDWTVAHSSATLDQPDKRQFGERWIGPYFNPGYPEYGVPPYITDPYHSDYKPAANINIGNLQRIWKKIDENSEQYFINVKFPFEQWSEDKGYLKFGIFNDHVSRHYNQDSFSNGGDQNLQHIGPWESHWSNAFPSENHPVNPSDIDVDYDGKQDISAWYYMADIPLCSWFKVIGGVRYETTELSIKNQPEQFVTWLPPGTSGWTKMNAGDGDVSFKQTDTLPSIGFEYEPVKKVTFRSSYSETIARQTFKELTPIQQSEYLGGDVFVGNPSLQMSSLKNYDLRLDWTPNEGGLISASYFYKEIKDPIEYVQKVIEFTFTTPENFPEGTLSGYEFEVRQKLGQLMKQLEGFSIGANATFIDSEVTLPRDETALLETRNVHMRKRDMLNAPSHLYNFYLTYDLEQTKTQLALFYTIRGDTLVDGAGVASGAFVPNVYETEYGTVNFTLSQKLGKIWKMSFKAKNLLDPEIKTVYRPPGGDDVTKTSYHKGREFVIGLSAEF